MKSILAVVIFTLTILLLGCNAPKDNLLLEFKIGHPFKEIISELETNKTGLRCFPRDSEYDVHHLLMPIRINSKIYNVLYLFNFNEFDKPNLEILTIQFAGKSREFGLNYYCSEIINEISKKELIEYLNEIYGNYVSSDSGYLSKDANNLKNIIIPKISNKSDDNKRKISQINIGETNTKFVDYLYLWDTDEFIIELIEYREFGVGYGLFVNYKQKNYNSTYEENIPKSENSYSLDELVEIKFKKPYITTINHKEFDRVLRIPVYSINRVSEAEPRNITDLQFNMLFYDEFDNLIFTWEKFTWDKKITFSSSAFMNGPEYEIKYIKDFKNHKELNLIEHKLEKVTIKTKVTAIRFEDGEIRKNQ